MSFLARTRILLSLTVLTLTHQVLHLEKKMNRDEEFDKKAFAVRVRDRRVSTKVGYFKGMAPTRGFRFVRASHQPLFYICVCPVDPNGS
jgi:hypothetical protein